MSSPLPSGSLPLGQVAKRSGGGSGSSAFVSPSTREIHVGDVPNAYATMELALAAASALAVPVSQAHPLTIVVHPGDYSPAAGPWAIPAGLGVVGTDGGLVGFSSADDIFDIQGDTVFFSDFHVRATHAPTKAIFRCNGHNYINISNVGLWRNGNNIQLYLVQSGNAWVQMSLGNCLIDAYGGGYSCTFTNTSGAARYVDVEISNVFADAWNASSSGGIFQVQGCQDFRIKNSKIRVGSGGHGISLEKFGVTGTPWVELFSVTSILQGASVGELLKTEAGTDARWAFCDGARTIGGTITVVGNGTADPGPQGPAGPTGPAGPASGLTTAYDLDLSTMGGPTAYSTDGIKTIDGRAAFRLSNSNHGQLIALNDGTHAGLYMRCSTFNSVNYGTTYNGPRFTIGLADLCGVKPRDTSEQWVWLMFSQPHAPNANYEYAYLGVSALPGADTDTAHATPVFDMLRGYTAGVTTQVEWQKGTTVTQNPTGVVPPLTTHDVYAFRIVGNEIIEAYAGTSAAGAWPALSDLVYIGRALYSTQAQGFDVDAAKLSPAFQWAAVISLAQSNTVGACDVLLKKLKVLYR